MRARDFRLLWAVLTLALILGGVPSPGWPDGSSLPALTGFHHTVASDRTRVVLDLTSRSGYEVRSFKNPDRVAVNLRNVRASEKLPVTDISEGIIRRIRVNRLSWGTQVVFDLRRPAGWSDLYLEPMDGMPGRVVIDVLSPAPARAAVPPSDPSPPAGAVVRAGDGAREKQPPSGKRVLIVAVDAGHGGKDWGTTGKYDLVEKKLVLDIARRIARSLDQAAGFKAVLTRDGDYYLDLVDRTKIAKKKKADVFVSIHLNSAPRKSARGMEVWFISPAGADAAAKRLLSHGETAAAKELGIEGPHSSDILHMLVDVNQQAMMQRSFLLAEEILKSADRKGLPPVRSVKQQSFAVLKSIDMPSVLVEAAFLTNTSDAKLMRTTEGRQVVAEAIAAGIVSFFKKYPPPPDSRGIARKVHKVRKGETLWAISRKYNTTVASIRSSNGLRNSDVLLVGQELVIRENHDGR
jgi:N-acetylmuramoyl-L-alanine amidase